MGALKKILKPLKRLLNKLFGTVSDELFWRFRHLLDSRWAESYISDASLNHPHRQLLSEKLSAFAPLESILEVGCASGPNLYLLAKRFPNAKLYGQDISKAAISTGKQWLEDQGVANVFLSVATINELKQFQDRSIDVVFTDAFLVHVGPEKIGSVLQELFRIARKALILVEWHRDASGTIYANQWIHNYRELLEPLVPPERLRFTKISPEIWPGDWAKYGHLIEVAL